MKIALSKSYYDQFMEDLNAIPGDHRNAVFQINGSTFDRDALRRLARSGELFDVLMRTDEEIKEIEDANYRFWNVLSDGGMDRLMDTLEEKDK
jgi:hypothetical protein